MTSAGGWPRGSRDEAWSRLGEPWDIVVVVGGITGAGILLEAARAGLRAVLVEQRDFAWGTSSRSSKLVHGGLRYLRQGHVLLTRAAARERQRLPKEAPGLVEPLGFLLPTRAQARRQRAVLHLGLALYDALAGRWEHPRFGKEDFAQRVSRMVREGIDGGYRFEDARTDDARLVLRVLREAQAHGALALNYARVESLLRTQAGVAGGRARRARRTHGGGDGARGRQRHRRLGRRAARAGGRAAAPAPAAGEPPHVRVLAPAARRRGHDPARGGPAGPVRDPVGGRDAGGHH